MARADGHIELDRTVESINVGYRTRQDMGDLEQLSASIDERGLLQPVTVTPDGTLICGARRLEAAKRLGIRQVNVWVRSGISSRLELLLAEQDENTMRKPLTPTEAAALYRELKTLLAEDAARRMQATQFGATGGNAVNSGSAKLAEPGDRTARAQAAQLVTGQNSYTTLERVGEIERIVADPQTSAGLRAVAESALAGIDADGKVNGHYQHVKDAQQDDRNNTLSTLAQDALARVRAGQHKPGKARTRNAREAGPLKKYGVRAFTVTWTEMVGWAEHYDPTEIGAALSVEQWNEFEDTLRATVRFADAAREARSS